MTTITVRPLKGESFNVAVEPEDKVENFKDRIEALKPEFPAGLLKLIHNGKLLEDGKTVSSYDIKPGGFVVVMVGKPKPTVAAADDASSAPAASTPTVESSSATPTPASTPAAGATAPAAPVAQAAAPGNEAAILQLCEMGFPREEVERCLRAAFGNADRAVEYLTTGLPAPRERSRSRSPAGGGHGDGHGGHGHEDDAGHSCGDHDCSGHDHGAAAAHGHGHGQRNASQHGANQGDAATSDPVLVMLAAAAAAEGAADGEHDDAGDDPMDGSVTVELTEAENTAVERLAGLGFSQEQALEAYLACDRKEELAANMLFEP